MKSGIQLALGALSVAVAVGAEGCMREVKVARAFAA
jgi:hypothetical protein